MMNKDRMEKSNTHAHVYYHLDVPLGSWVSISDGVLNGRVVLGVCAWVKVDMINARRCMIRNM